jgi:polyferredoxin
VKWLLLGFFVYHIFNMPGSGLRAFIESPYNRVSDIKMGLFFVEIGRVGAIMMVLLVLGSTFINGFWCRYLCPYGAFLGFFARFSPTRVQRDPVSCIDCGKCDAICMARLPVSKSENVFSVECTGCMDCVAACPVDDALQVKAGPRRVPVWGFATAVLLLFLGGYVGARVSGLWQNSITDQEYIYRIETMDGPGYGHPGMGGR